MKNYTFLFKHIFTYTQATEASTNKVLWTPCISQLHNHSNLLHFIIYIHNLSTSKYHNIVFVICVTYFTIMKQMLYIKQMH